MYNLITEHLDIWTSAKVPKSNVGRGNGSVNGKAIYGIKKLRELILELAVRGKLVPQDPTDEPANVLLEKIAKEKERLTKEGKIKLQKPLSKIVEDEEPYNLPQGWVWTKLGNYIYLEMGQSPPSKSYNQDKNGMAFFQGKADFGFLYPTPRYWCTDPNKYALPGDILLSVRAPVGPVNISNIECCIGRGLASLRPLGGTSTLMLFYLMRAYEKKLVEFATGTTFSAISKTDIETLTIPVPPLAEQHRIVAKVDELMALCDQLEKQETENTETHQTLVKTLLSTLTSAADHIEFTETWNRIKEHFDILFTTEESIDQIKQTILQLAVMGKLVEQNPEDENAGELLIKIAKEKEKLIKEGKIKEIKNTTIDIESDKNLPVGWSNAFFQDITKVITCGMASTPIYRKEGKIFLSAKNVKPYRFMPQEHQFVDEDTYKRITKYAKPEKGDILLTRVGAGIGEAAIIDQEIDFAFYVSLTLIKPFLEYLDSMFLLHWLNSPEGVKKSIENIYGNGVSQGNLNVKQVRGFVIPIPPLKEQHRIVAKVEEIISLCENMKIKIVGSQTTTLQIADAIVNQVVA